MIRFAFIEDSAPYLKVLRSIVQSHSAYHSDSSYVDAESFMEDLNAVDFEIVFVDLQLPNMTGMELTYHLKKLKPETKILICTSYDDQDKLFECLKNGADGYLLKSSTPDQILAAIDDVMSGGAPMSQSIAKKVIAYFFQSSDRKESLALLTPKENEIISLLGEGLLYKEIPERAGCSLETVKKHCSNIYKKLQVSNRTEALKLYFNM